MSLQVIILAAGKGKRMKTTTPKVMHELGGIPLLERVVNTASSLNPKCIHVIYGNGGSAVRHKLAYLPVHWVEQKEQLGTGHAVMQALPFCDEGDQVLVLYGDVPLISKQTLEKLLKQTPKKALGIIVVNTEDPKGLGRIVRNEVGHIISIVEEKDATDVQKNIQEINTGIIACSAAHLHRWLPKLEANNNQKEYYLTDVVAHAVVDGYLVNGILAGYEEEVRGINNLWQLSILERFYQTQEAKKLALQGIVIRDPNRFHLRGTVSIDEDSVIDINVILEGKVHIGKNCYLGPNCIIKDAIIGDNVTIEANSMIDGSIIEGDSIIGPYARIRPDSKVCRKARVGNFVELKKTTLGPNSKANHLAYLGDTTIGKNVNIGAGTITCNYDGVNKHETIIDDEAFIGSNASLIAPVHIEKGATVGAGSAVSKCVPAGKLVVARGKQVTIDSWVRPKKEEIS